MALSRIFFGFANDVHPPNDRIAPWVVYTPLWCLPVKMSDRYTVSVIASWLLLCDWSFISLFRAC